MTINQKCLAVTFVSTTLLLAVTGSGYWGISSISRTANEMLNREIQTAEHAYFVKIHIFQMRRHEKDILLNSTQGDKVDAFGTRFLREQQDVQDHLLQLEQLVHRPEHKQLVALMGKELKVYANGVNQVTAAIKAGTLRTPQEANRAVVPYKLNAYNLEDAAEDLAEEAKLQAAAAAASLQHQARSTLLVMGSLGLAGVVLGVLLSYLIGRNISRAVKRLAVLLRDVADGEGDLTKRLEVRGRDEVGEAASWFNAFVAKVHDIVAQARLVGEQVGAAAGNLAAASEELSAGAQEQASSLEETAASLEELTSSVNQNSDNANQAKQLADASRGTAETGGHIAKESADAMSEISQAAQRITDIIASIDEIAFQTNLLALNAAVEAARAGEHGRGFAVVATEVRSLAQRAAVAAKEIRSLIHDAVRKTATGTELANRSSEKLQEILASVRRVAGLMTEVAAASQEQSTGINQVSRAVSQMDSVVQQNAAQTEELSSTSQGLVSQADRLQGLIRRFKVAELAPAVAVPGEPGVVDTVNRGGQGRRRLPVARRVDAGPSNGRDKFVEF
ncbi:hypothetical protein AYO40_01315 [Planctomycetaceae bacterium SCGC AG-212-D15]|nr:hypothetical protein AYO40_01315 [Planctomycetaceae bacterium SCGC AG-212-D15]